jgi:tRNA-intron endonuclease, archaea type
MPAELRADHAWLADEAEASRLYNKGAFGTPERGGALRLDLLEAALLVEEGKLEVAGADLASLLALGSRLDEAFETRWLAFRDLRKRGFIAKAAGWGEHAGQRGAADFFVYPRGGFPGRTPASHEIVAVSERGTFDLERLVAHAAEAQRFDKTLWLAIVDEEGDITYYDCSAREPRGATPPRPRDLKGCEAEVLRDRAILWGKEEARALHAEEFLGRPLGDALLLSLTETLWLAEHAGLRLRDAAGQGLAAEELARRAGKLQREFGLRYAAYKVLRARGLVVKTGFKYGTHFRAYAEDPGHAHAEFLVHALPEGFTCPWPDIAGVVRLAHSVRKTLLFVSGERVLALQRARP